MANKKAKENSRLQRVGAQAGRNVLQFLASRGLFVAMILVAIVIVAWFTWSRAIQPILVDAGLPPGIPESITRVNVTAAQDIAEQRNERVNHVLRSYTRFSSVFKGGI